VVVMNSRRAVPGERCTCGRQAVTVFEFGRADGVDGERAPIGYCGIPDGGDRSQPCPFCGGPGPEHGVCPRYRLRPQGTAWERHDDPQAQG
jgi:hypothetical protein